MTWLLYNYILPIIVTINYDMGTTQGSISVTSNFPITLNINVSILSFLILVSGDANFHMKRSALTVGFTQ